MAEFRAANVRQIFLNSPESVPVGRAAELLGISLQELERDMDDGAIVAVSTSGKPRIDREELMATAMQKFEQARIEEALGEDAVAVLPEAIRLVDLRSRVPRYQRDVLEALATQRGTSVDDVLTRELEDVVSAYADDVAAQVPALADALAWPGR